MRVEPYGIDSILHVIKRGARGLPIVRDDPDCWRFVRLLYYANDEYRNDFWEIETASLGVFGRPRSWPARKPIVKILAWALMPNHFHLVLKEIEEGGIAKFMQKLCGSMSMNFNVKYGEKGSIFQGAYKGKTLDDDFYLRHIAPYVMVKNVFEAYPRGYARAVAEFDRAWKWAVEEYKFSSLPDYAAKRISPIVDKDLLGDFFSSPGAFRAYAKEMIRNRTVESNSDLFSVTFEEKKV
ncbi:MAG: transposase [Patescibacteria group bacterium]